VAAASGSLPMVFPFAIGKAFGLADGPAHGRIAIAKLRLTMPPIMRGDFAFALESSVDLLGKQGIQSSIAVLHLHHRC